MALVADPPTLQSYLGIDTIDTTRALTILEMATDLCSTIVSPLPPTAAVVVLTVAARAFSNPEGVTAETVGPYHVQHAPGAFYLSKADKAALRRLSGGVLAFDIDTMPLGVNAVQVITITATGGTFAVSLSGQSTGQLAWDITPGDLATAIGNLSLVGAGNVSVAGTGPYTVTFVNALATTPLPTMVGDGSNLTGPSAGVAIVTSVPGVFGPGQNLAPWDKDYFQSDGVGGGGDMVGNLGGGPY